ncbi:MAG: hypothetical protein H2069_01800 [Legionella sp.]|nr:hypothetical protein [Legionella sp.]
MKLSDVFKDFIPPKLEEGENSEITLFLNSTVLKQFIEKTSINIKFQDFPKNKKIYFALQQTYLLVVQYWLTHQEMLGQIDPQEPYFITLNMDKYESVLFTEPKLKDAFAALKLTYVKETNQEVNQALNNFLYMLYECASNQAISYLLITEKIRSPLEYQVTEAARDTAARLIRHSYLNTRSEDPTLNQKFSQTPVVFVPGGSGSSGDLAKFYTYKQRYNTPIKHYPSLAGINPHDIFHPDNAIKIYTIVRDAIYRKRRTLINATPYSQRYPLTSKTLVQAMEKNNCLASNFKPFTLYEVIHYIEYHTNRGKFNPHPPFKVYYDPCAGWGERESAAYLSRDYFEELYINDINKDLEEPYNALTAYLQGAYPYKKVTCTFQEALDITPPVKADFCFSGLPAYNTEEYNYGRTDRYENHTAWLKNWCLPLMFHLLNITKPGGYVAVNLGKDKSGHSLTKAILKMIEETPMVKERITDASYACSQELYYHSAATYASQMLIFQKTDLQSVPQPLPGAVCPLHLKERIQRRLHHQNTSQKPVAHTLDDGHSTGLTIKDTRITLFQRLLMKEAEENATSSQKPFKIIRSIKPLQAFGLLGQRSIEKLYGDLLDKAEEADLCKKIHGT